MYGENQQGQGGPDIAGYTGEVLNTFANSTPQTAAANAVVQEAGHFVAQTGGFVNNYLQNLTGQTSQELQDIIHSARSKYGFNGPATNQYSVLFQHFTSIANEFSTFTVDAYGFEVRTNWQEPTESDLARHGLTKQDFDQIKYFVEKIEVGTREYAFSLAQAEYANRDGNLERSSTVRQENQPFEFKLFDGGAATAGAVIFGAIGTGIFPGVGTAVGASAGAALGGWVAQLAPEEWKPSTWFTLPVPQNTVKGGFVGAFSGMAAGAGIGAMAGAPVGGVGAIPGALIGGTIGFIGGLVGGGAAGHYYTESVANTAQLQFVTKVVEGDASITLPKEILERARNSATTDYVHRLFQDMSLDQEQGGVLGSDTFARWNDLFYEQLQRQQVLNKINDPNASLQDKTTAAKDYVVSVFGKEVTKIFDTLGVDIGKASILLRSKTPEQALKQLVEWMDPATEDRIALAKANISKIRGYASLSENGFDFGATSPMEIFGRISRGEDIAPLMESYAAKVTTGVKGLWEMFTGWIGGIAENFSQTVAKAFNGGSGDLGQTLNTMTGNLFTYKSATPEPQAQQTTANVRSDRQRTIDLESQQDMTYANQQVLANARQLGGTIVNASSYSSGGQGSPEAERARQHSIV